MQIILLERIEKLGQMGELVNVKPGYARNYLLPQGKALRANKLNMERFETERTQREADNLTLKSEAEAEAKKMDRLSVSMVRAASEMGQLFGSVTSRDIADAVSDAGFTIDRSQVIMERSIKSLGLTDARVRLHPEVSVTVIINIARSLAEAETQLKTGVAITGDMNVDSQERVETLSTEENVRESEGKIAAIEEATPELTGIASNDESTAGKT
jgi:large subunit ribosomal protein L9